MPKKARKIQSKKPKIPAELKTWLVPLKYLTPLRTNIENIRTTMPMLMLLKRMIRDMREESYQDGVAEDVSFHGLGPKLVTSVKTFVFSDADVVDGQPIDAVAAAVGPVGREDLIILIIHHSGGYIMGHMNKGVPFRFQNWSRKSKAR